MARITGEPTGSWTLLRVKPNSAGAGTFADDTDYAGTNTLPDLTERIGVSSTGSASARVSAMVVAIDVNGEAVDRSTFTMAVDFIEIAATRGNETLFAGLTDFAVDSTPLTSVPANRKVELGLEKGVYALRLHTFANIPAAATELRVFVKVS